MEKSLLYGAIVGTSLQLAIEIKDAYAPYWGFSYLDLATGTAGAFIRFLYKNKFLKVLISSFLIISGQINTFNLKNNAAKKLVA